MKRVLVISEDTATRAAFQSALSRLNYDLMVVSCAKAALAEVRSKPIDVVFLECTQSTDAWDAARDTVQFLSRDEHAVSVYVVVSDDDAVYDRLHELIYCGIPLHTLEKPLSHNDIRCAVEAARRPTVSPYGPAP